MSSQLAKILALLNDEKEIDLFLKDLLSPKEFELMQERWKVVQLLEEQRPYREIAQITGVSTATVTRVARCLGSKNSGYAKALARIKN
jgi:TrpR-related protein YerC/YecD